MNVFPSKVMFLTDFTEKPQYVPDIVFMRQAGSQLNLPTSLPAINISSTWLMIGIKEENRNIIQM